RVRRSGSLTSGRPPLTPTEGSSLRKAKGMGRMKLAARVRECGWEIDKDREPPSLDSVLKCINRVERGEVRRPGSDLYAPAFAAALDRDSAHIRASGLTGAVQHPPSR